MPSSISDPFVVTNLPRLPPKTEAKDLCRIPALHSATASTFDMATSGSYIGTFITRPSPRMIWSYALSPQSVVHAMDSLTLDETEEKLEHKVFAVALTERRKHYLKYVSYGRPRDTEDDEASIAVSNEEDRNTAEPEPLKEVKTSETTVSQPIIDLKLSKDGSKVYTLRADAQIGIYKFGEETPIDSVPLSRFNRGTKVVYHCFVDPEELQLKHQQQTKVDTVVLLVDQTKAGELTCRICAIAKNNVLELATTKLELPEVTTSKYQYCYDPAGTLVAVNESLQLQTFSLPYATREKTLELAGIFSAEPEDAPVSIIGIAPHRVLVSKGSTLALVDVLHGACLATLDLYARSKVNAAKAPREATLLQCPLVKGNSLRTKETFALVLLKNTKENYIQLDQVSVDVGLGRLRDVLGMGLKETVKRKQFVGLPLLVTRPELKSTVRETAGLMNRSGEGSNKLSRVIHQFERMKKEKNLDDLESYIVAFLKMDVEADAGKGYKFKKNGGDNKFRVFEVDKDRIVDPFFIKKITKLLFEEGGEEENDGEDGDGGNEEPTTTNGSADATAAAVGKVGRFHLSDDFVAERALTYLLTHPLFPKEYTPGLLSVLEKSPRLMRQAIVTCPNIPCSDLIEELSHVDNEDIFRDVIARLVDEFSTERITQETVSLLRKQSSRAEGNVDLDRIIQKILKLNYGYEILNSFIDSNGLVLSLHYSKNQTQLSKLMDKAQAKIDALTADTQLLSLVDQALVLAEIEGKQRKKSTVIETESRPADDVLRVCCVGEPEPESVPQYSIERLAI